MNAGTQYEAVIFSSFEHEGETKHKRTFIGNLKAANDGESFQLYIPDGIAVSGRVVIQPKQAQQDEG